MLFGRRKYRNLNTLHVFKDALKHNLHAYQKLCPGQAICPVLKSNAYGHGLTLVAKALDNEGAPFFIVDSLYEAYELKKARIKTPVLIIGALHPENTHGRHFPFHFAVFNKESAELFAKMDVPVHIKIETGLSRMGFSMKQLKESLPYFKKIGLNIEGIYTHFADADNPQSDAKTEEQVERFEEALALVEAAGFKPKWIHCANSAGALKVKNPKFNMVRLGIGLYEATMELESTLVAIDELKKGETVGYGCTFTAPKNMRVGVIPVGYYEAIPRSLSNKGFVEVNGKLCPMLGRVSMNMCTFDLEGVEAKLFDPVIVYSRHAEQKNSVPEQSHAAGMIPYELLVHISESVARRLQ